MKGGKSAGKEMDMKPNFSVSSKQRLGLSKVERTVIAFRWQGYTLHEIAEKTSSSASTVHRIEKHAIAKLKAWLFGDS